MPMRRGDSINSDRNDIWTYVEGPQMDAYNELHAAFVSQHLLIDEGLSISRSEIAAIYLDWIRIHFNPNQARPNYKDLHNLNLHLLIGQGVDEEGEGFVGIGPRH